MSGLGGRMDGWMEVFKRAISITHKFRRAISIIPKFGFYYGVFRGLVTRSMT
jgi:hypothetical protein